MNKTLLQILHYANENLRVLLCSLLLAFGLTASAQTDVTIRGVVKDSISGIPSANVRLLNSKSGVATDGEGRYTIKAPLNAQLVFSVIGYKTRTVAVANYKPNAEGIYIISLTLKVDDSSLEEVAITGFGNTQRKASMVSAITTVNVKDLKTPSSNLTNALAGRIAGVIAFQGSGEPGLGTDNSNFYIRGLSTFGTGKQDPLILIDGIESSSTDMARLQPDDISDFSVLKDAAAAAVYGARGANGVVLINTKMGQDGKPQFTFRAEGRISKNTRDYEFADNITYMKTANEAAVTRSVNGIEPYSQNKINSTAAGEDPYLYPNNNWLSQLIKSHTINQGYNLNITGGSTRARYYIAGTYNLDNGNLKVDPRNDFNSNIRLANYSIRSNVDFNVTKSTVLILRMYGQFDDYQGPIGGYNEKNERISGGEQTFRNALRANPVMFPAVYPSDKLPFIEHPLFGSAQTRNSDLSLSPTMYINPYAEMVKGYQVYKTSNLQPQIELKQDLSGITEGLTARAMGYLRRISFYRVNRSYSPFFYSAIINSQDQSYNLVALNDGGTNSLLPVGEEFLNYKQDSKEIDSRLWAEGSVNYSRLFNKHSVSGMVVTYMSDYENVNIDELIQSLPSRNAGISGRVAYGYDDRYLAEFNFGYNGSERFDIRNRWGFFPSAGIGYRISREKFFEPLLNVISSLKLRATYGIVGNDAIGNVKDRFFYMSNVSLNNAGFGATFGRNDGAPTYYRPGVSISRYANADIKWEKSSQINLGMDITFGRNFDVIIEAFKQNRTNILQSAENIDNAAGLMAIPFSNFGAVSSKGLDVSANYRKTFSNGLWIDARGTFTYATTKIEKIDELPYPSSIAYLSRKGAPIKQEYGYIAERLFVDDEEVANSPVQFGDRGLKGGDIKYRDINKDGVINSDDKVALGYPTEPEINFGFGSSFGYKHFDFSFYFQGAARFSFFINSQQIQPFYQNGGAQTGLLKAIADNHWSETNGNLYAFWPRLSTWRVDNNNQISSWWMRNADFLRLKNVELGYSFTKLEKIKIKSARLYFSATNLIMFSKFKLWDAEMRGNGMNYPLQSLYNLGLQINL